MLRERGDARLSAHHLGRGLRPHRARASAPASRGALAFYLTSRAHHQRDRTTWRRRSRASSAPTTSTTPRASATRPSTGAMKHALGVAATTCSYRDWWGTDLIVFFGSNPANDQPVAMKYLRRGQAPRHSSRHGEPVPRAGHGTLLGAVDAAQRAVRHRHRRLLVRRRAGRRHRVPVRRASRSCIEQRLVRPRLRRRSTPPASRRSPPPSPALDWPPLEQQAGLPRAEHGGVRRPDPRRAHRRCSCGAWASPSTPSAARRCR